MKSESEKGRLATLAYRLAAATGQRAARWELKGPDVYSWEAPEGTVTVASRDHDGEPPYELALYNARSEKVDELASELLGDDQPAPWNEALAELYRVARPPAGSGRGARGVAALVSPAGARKRIVVTVGSSPPEPASLSACLTSRRSAVRSRHRPSAEAWLAEGAPERVAPTLPGLATTEHRVLDQRLPELERAGGAAVTQREGPGDGAVLREPQDAKLAVDPTCAEPARCVLFLRRRSARPNSSARNSAIPSPA
jgi:hypothetical protein